VKAPAVVVNSSVGSGAVDMAWIPYRWC